MQHPLALTLQSKFEFVAIPPIQLVKNPQEVGHSPICMHIGAFVWFVNIVAHGSTFRKVLIWGLKGHDLC